MQPIPTARMSHSRSRIVFAISTLLIGINADEPVRNVKTVYKDVAIIGGGASGSYSAVRLREDYGVSVILIEKDTRLVSTYAA
jgi:heterodisulfide reductase subunit A-like polyferredoxin